MSDLVRVFSDYRTAYSVTIVVFCLGTLVSACESLAIRNEFQERGVFAWRLFSSTPRYLNAPFPIPRLAFLFEYSGFLVGQLITIFCALVLPFVVDKWLGIVLVSILAFVSLVFSFRNPVGGDGADQMRAVICMTLLVAFLSRDRFVSQCGLVFIAAESLLAYLAAGIAKLGSEKWRRGVAVYQIMNTRTYGDRAVAASLHDLPREVNYAICWAVILVESLLWLAVILPAPYCLLLLGCGALFHIYNSIAMGLNNFVWAFLATYPAILFVNQLLTR